MFLNPYWVTTENLGGACYEATVIEDVYAQARKRGRILSVKRLPYPAEPRLSKIKGDTPSFCYQPEKCAGRSAACPANRACTE